MNRLWMAWVVVAVLQASSVHAQSAAPTPSSRPQPVSAAPVSGGYAGAMPASQSGALAGTAAPVVPGPGLAGLGTDYRIGPNDLLEVEVFGVPDLKRTVRVNSSGLVSLPLVGPVSIGGLKAEEAETRLAEAYGAKYLQNPQVSIFIKEFTTQRITLEGAVRSPGVYPFTGQITLLRAIAQAGGRGDLADLSRVMIFRNKPGAEPETTTYDLTDIQTGKAPDPILKADDVIVVSRAPGRVLIRDSVFGDILGIFNPFTYVRP